MHALSPCSNLLDRRPISSSYTFHHVQSPPGLLTNPPPLQPLQPSPIQHIPQQALLLPISRRCTLLVNTRLNHTLRPFPLLPLPRRPRALRPSVPTLPRGRRNVAVEPLRRGDERLAGQEVCGERVRAGVARCGRGDEGGLPAAVGLEVRVVAGEDEFGGLGWWWGRHGKSVDAFVAPVALVRGGAAWCGPAVRLAVDL